MGVCADKGGSLKVAVACGLLLLLLLSFSGKMVYAQDSEQPRESSNGEVTLDPNSDEGKLVENAQEFSEKLAGYLGKFTLVLIMISSAAFVFSLLVFGAKYAGGGESAMLAKQQLKRSVGFFTFLVALNFIFGAMYFFLKVL